MSWRKQIESGRVSSIRQAAASGISPPLIRRGLALGVISAPPWTAENLLEVRDCTDPDGRRRGNRAAHRTITRWNAGCGCVQGRRFQSEDAWTLHDLGLTFDQAWGITKTGDAWSAALTGTRRDYLKHGTNAAYVAGCVCFECREYQRQRMARQRV
jgi:hypothetical protein